VALVDPGFAVADGRPDIGLAVAADTVVATVARSERDMTGLGLGGFQSVSPLGKRTSAGGYRASAPSTSGSEHSATMKPPVDTSIQHNPAITPECPKSSMSMIECPGTDPDPFSRRSAATHASASDDSSTHTEAR